MTEPTPIQIAEQTIYDQYCLSRAEFPTAEEALAHVLEVADDQTPHDLIDLIRAGIETDRTRRDAAAQAGTSTAPQHTQAQAQQNLPAVTARAAARLAQAFRAVGVSVTVASHVSTVSVTHGELRRVADQLRYAEADCHSVHRVLNVLSRLFRTAGEPIEIKTNDAITLTRTLEEAEREIDRARKLAHGIIPGTLSGREVSQLIRRGHLRP